MQLAQRLGLTVTGSRRAGQSTQRGFNGHSGYTIVCQRLCCAYRVCFGPCPFGFNPHKIIHSVAWCTGGAQGYIEHAIAAGADAYLTGEVSERTFHEAQENGMSFFAAGHHATERYGVQALGEWLVKRFGIRAPLCGM